MSTTQRVLSFFYTHAGVLVEQIPYYVTIGVVPTIMWLLIFKAIAALQGRI